jgi:SAM-dependent methyltransferase
MSPRLAKLLSGIDVATMSGLEIGPLDRPIGRKTDGHKVKYLDHESPDVLRERYRTHQGVNTSRIEELDYVAGDASLLDLIPERFDYVLASHVLEHIPNPVRWLQELSELMKPGGILSLAMPDRRYCFDALRPATSIGEILEAYVLDRKRPTLWAGVDISQMPHKKPNAVQLAMSRAQEGLRTGKYVDCHCNLVTADEFRRLIAVLAELNLLPTSG